MNTAGTMYLQAVMPAIERLTSAPAPLRISPEAHPAAAARDLTSVVITYANEAKSGGKRFKLAQVSKLSGCRDLAWRGALTRSIGRGLAVARGAGMDRVTVGRCFAAMVAP